MKIKNQNLTKISQLTAIEYIPNNKIILFGRDFPLMIFGRDDINDELDIQRVITNDKKQNALKPILDGQKNVLQIDYIKNG